MEGKFMSKLESFAFHVLKTVLIAVNIFGIAVRTAYEYGEKHFKKPQSESSTV
jgi:hypothetical protein